MVEGPGLRARDLTVMVTGFAKGLVREKADALLQGKGNQDIFTLLGVLPLHWSLPVSLVDISQSRPTWMQTRS